jgi:hypothetical protein
MFRSDVYGTEVVSCVIMNLLYCRQAFRLWMIHDISSSAVYWNSSSEVLEAEREERAHHITSHEVV